MIHPIKHFITITKHRHLVMHYCFKCGLIRQGLMHDLSKYGFTEFWSGAKYYSGDKSPHVKQREKCGYSIAWLHHKGRNKHHIDYWVDSDPKTHIIGPVIMPNKYIAEAICDRIAASKVYNKKKYVPQDVLDYFNKEMLFLPVHEEVKKKFEFLLNYYVQNGQKALFKYMKKNMRK
ncbi:MAG: DUF5662 family protein [Acholeplasmatales bacterium]|nr:DUF5662 family protein [Acholeplasmatales bacterium]